MFSKRLLFQYVSPKVIFTILVWLIIAWILSRPLIKIGESIYNVFGTSTYKVFKLISNTKSSLSELFKSKFIIKKQAEEITKLTVKLNQIENQVNESKELKHLIELNRSLGFKSSIAKVIGRTADNWHKQIIINSGINHGINIGDSVLSTKGIIGQVVDVNSSTSIVQLVSDSSYKVGCKVRRNNTLGILTGKTNSLAQVKFIPIGSDVKVRDLIVTSGIASEGLKRIYPTNHPIGYITKVSNNNNVDLYIEVKLSEDSRSLDNVLIFSQN